MEGKAMKAIWASGARPWLALGWAALLLAGWTAAPPADAAATPMAAGLSWKGFVDTNLKFSEFFANDHTIVLRFMAQFPNAYEGPMVAENGSGRFVIGQ